MAVWLITSQLRNRFVAEDPNYNYLSGRWPGDAELLAKKLIEMVEGNRSHERL